MISFEEEFRSVDTGAPVHFRNLTLFPLMRPTRAGAAPNYLLLEDAVQRGLARITEVNGGGSVPELRFENGAERPVLLFDGEELIGAKQNRVLNLTILAPAKQTIVIPVSCVEAGRWHMETPEFTPSPRLMYSRARASRAAQVTRSMRTTGARQSDQSAVWNEIAAKALRMEAPSPTHAMAALFERHAVSVEEYVRAFAWQPGQAGVAFAIGGRLAGIDLLDYPAAMERLFPKLVRSYALDALDAPEEKSDPAKSEALSALLAGVTGAPLFAQPALGAGKDVRFSGASASGAALWAEERYVHICAFAADGSSSDAPFRTRIARRLRR